MPFELGIIRNHYVGRTFIEPTDHIRNLGVKLKHSANRAVLAGRRVVLVDDSIVRGTTSRKIVEMVRQAGAKEVHMRVSSPPTTHSCFYGIDTPERGKLLAARNSVEEMAQLDRRGQPGVHLDRRAVPCARHGRPAMPRDRITAMPVSPAIIRFRCRTRATTPSGSSACWTAIDGSAAGRSALRW